MPTTKPMLPRERVLAALARKPVDRIPYIEHLVDADVAFGAAGFFGSLAAQLRIGRRLGITGVLRDLPAAFKAKSLNQMGGFPPLTSSVTNVMNAAEPEISRILGRDNITFWGAFLCFTNNMPYLLKPEQAHLGASADGMIKTRKDLDKMKFRDIDEVVAQAEKFLKHKGDYAANAMLFLGIDPCWHSMGFETFATGLIEDPELVGEVLRRITDWYARAAEAMCALDFDFIWVADDIAYHTAPMFSPRQYRNVLLPHTRKVAEKITKPWIYHSDGNLMPLLDDLISQGMHAIHPLEPGAMDPSVLKEKYGQRIAFVGNINIDTLSRGETPDVVKEVKETISILGPDYGYLMSSSNSIAPGCKSANVKAMLKALRENGRYPLANHAKKE